MTTREDYEDAARAAGIQGAPLSDYSTEDRAFFEFWYGHMLNDQMQPPLSNIDHGTARYIWDAAVQIGRAMRGKS